MKGGGGVEGCWDGSVFKALSLFSFHISMMFRRKNKEEKKRYRKTIHMLTLIPRNAPDGHYS